MKVPYRSVRLAALLIQTATAAITLDVSNEASIKAAAGTAAAGMVQYYTGYRPGDVAGNLPNPYYWWEAGAMFGALIDYWYFTGDSQYNNITMQAMLHQAGSDGTFMPLNQTKTEGNDDQSFWGLAAMSAAENKFPNPPSGQPQWLAMAQAVFNTQAARWDPSTCGGGLRWQIFQFNSGYTYKNTISNGCFFNMAARLAVYTGNSSYADWADRMWDWAGSIGLYDSKYNFYDGSDDTINCTQLDHDQWSYNPGVFLLGAANMYNYTNGSAVWETRIKGIIANLGVFMKNDVLFESHCEDTGSCNTDQQSFKAYLARWMAASAVRAPFAYSLIKPILAASAEGAAAACSGGSDGNQCGFKWTTGAFDGLTGVGEQMSALEVFNANLIDYVAGPATANNGISVGDPSAGSTKSSSLSDLLTKPVTTADRAGAGILTALVILLVIGAAIWMVL